MLTVDEILRNPQIAEDLLTQEFLGALGEFDDQALASFAGNGFISAQKDGGLLWSATGAAQQWGKAPTHFVKTQMSDMRSDIVYGHWMTERVSASIRKAVHSFGTAGEAADVLLGIETFFSTMQVASAYMVTHLRVEGEKQIREIRAFHDALSNPVVHTDDQKRIIDNSSSPAAVVAAHGEFLRQNAATLQGVVDDAVRQLADARTTLDAETETRQTLQDGYDQTVIAADGYFRAHNALEEDRARLNTAIATVDAEMARVSVVSPEHDTLVARQSDLVGQLADLRSEQTTLLDKTQVELDRSAAIREDIVAQDRQIQAAQDAVDARKDIRDSAQRDSAAIGNETTRFENHAYNDLNARAGKLGALDSGLAVAKMLTGIGTLSAQGNTTLGSRCRRRSRSRPPA
jgi:hypothetical protein